MQIEMISFVLPALGFCLFPDRVIVGAITRFFVFLVILCLVHSMKVC
jgi:hypothetical protein